MTLKKGLLLVFFILIFRTIVYAENYNTNKLEVYFFNDSVVEEKSNGISLFLFSNGYIEKDIKKDMYLIFSNLNINKEIDGNIYSIFSDINIEDEGSVKKNIKTFSSSVSDKSKNNTNISSYYHFIKKFVSINDTNNSKIYSDKLPNLFIITVFIILKVFILFTLLSLKVSFFLQGSVTILKEPLKVLSNGVIVSFILLSLAFVFGLSIIGLIFTIIILVLMYILTLCGEVCLAITVGDAILKKFNLSVYSNMIFGVIIIEIVSYIPFCLLFFKFIILPIICTGICYTCIVNGFVKKIFYDVKFEN